MKGEEEEEEKEEGERKRKKERKKDEEKKEEGREEAYCFSFFHHSFLSFFLSFFLSIFSAFVFSRFVALLRMQAWLAADQGHSEQASIVVGRRMLHTAPATVPSPSDMKREHPRRAHGSTAVGAPAG